MRSACVAALLLRATCAVGHMHGGDQAMNESMPLSEEGAHAAMEWLKTLHEFAEGHMAISLQIFFDNCKGQAANFSAWCDDVAEEDCNPMVCKDESAADESMCEGLGAPYVYASRRRSCYDPNVTSDSACSDPYRWDEIQPESVCCDGDGRKECVFDASGNEYPYPCCDWCSDPSRNYTCSHETYIGIALLGTTQGQCWGCVAGDTRFTDGDEGSCQNSGVCADPDGEGCNNHACCSAENFTQAVWVLNTSALSQAACDQANYCAICTGCPHGVGDQRGCETCGVCTGGSNPSSTDEGDCTSAGGTFTAAVYSTVSVEFEDQCGDMYQGEYRAVQHYEEGEILQDRTLHSHESIFQTGPTHMEPKHILPTDCVDPAQLLADAMAGMTAQEAFDANPHYYEQRIYRGSLMRAVLSNNESAAERSKMTFSEFEYPLCYVGLWEPTNKGQVVIESSNRTYALVLNPDGRAGGDPLSFSGEGSVSVLGGTSRGSIQFDSTGKVEVYGVENWGPITAMGSPAIVIANVTNRATGSITATGVIATLIDVVNEGDVMADGNFTAYDIVNYGNVIVNSGSIDLELLCPHDGMVLIKEGVVGSVKYQELCRGNITVPSTVQEIMVAVPFTSTRTDTTTTNSSTSTMTTTTVTTATMTATTVTMTDTTVTMTGTTVTMTATTATWTVTTETTTSVTATTVTATTATATTVTATTTATTSTIAVTDASTRADVTGAAVFVMSWVFLSW